MHESNYFFLLYNNLFIYQVLFTLIDHRRSVYSFSQEHVKTIKVNKLKGKCPFTVMQSEILISQNTLIIIPINIIANIIHTMIFWLKGALQYSSLWWLYRLLRSPLVDQLISCVSVYCLITNGQKHGPWWWGTDRSPFHTSVCQLTHSQGDPPLVGCVAVSQH